MRTKRIIQGCLVFAGQAWGTSLAWAQQAAAAAGAPGGGAGKENIVESTRKIFDWVVQMAVQYSFQVLGGIVILIAGWLVARYITNLLQKFLLSKNVDVTVTKFIVMIAKLIVMALAFLLALGKFGVEIAPLIAGLSVVGFGMSFALQGTLSNYVAGASLVFTKPFKVGDIIEVAGELGEVQDMTLPRTILKTVDGVNIFIPNKHIIGEIIQNYSELKRLDIKVGVSYKADIAKAIRVMKEVIGKDARVHNHEKPNLGISEFADSSINLHARLRVRQADYYDVMFSLNKAIFDAFKANDVEIPFPQRDVHLFPHKA
ncbi:MAG: mechanosensitive ion channel family protein [Deltaproteobacteria bacterium]